MEKYDVTAISAGQTKIPGTSFPRRKGAMTEEDTHICRRKKMEEGREFT